MNRRNLLTWMGLSLATAAFVCGFDPGSALAAPPPTYPGSVPDYYETPNWANSPPLRKFVDGLPGLCGSPLGTDPDGTNTLGQCMPVAVPDTATYPGSDYYEIELVQYREQLHTDLPPVSGTKTDPAATGGTLLRGYRQTNGGPALLTPHYLGPLIIASKYDPNFAPGAALPGGGTNGKPVRIKFTNSLPSGPAGNLFLPVDTTIMGSGAFEIDYDPETKAPVPLHSGTFSQNRATLHLHGGLSPWISDGTPHQWVTPALENTTYPKGISVAYVPDMWFDSTNGATITACAGQTTCTAPNATNNPGAGAQTFYYTNSQSARLLFYHDHAWGITRLNVYAGEAAGYLITDATEQALISAGTLPGVGIPLVIQDKTFVDATALTPTHTENITTTDPTWAWGTNPGQNPMQPVTGDLWWPHVYMPAQNPFDITGGNAMGRWMYGPWFFPPTPVCGSSPDAVKPYCIEVGTVPNPYYDPNCDPAVVGFCQPPEIPGTPNVSWGAEAFLDTMLVNGTAYPSMEIAPGSYRFRILNAAHDRHLNLQFYVADPSYAPGDPGYLKEVKMVPAAPTAGYPENWPTDGREGGVPDPALRGPAFIQIGTEAGFLAGPAVLPNQPVRWNQDPTMFNVGNVLQQNQGGGTLMLGPAERADVIVDFTPFAGKTLILYNDAPAAWPALDPHYDYYTGAPDRTDIGGANTIPAGFAPNVRTVMQINVTGSGGVATPDYINPATLTALQTAFASTPGTPGVFARSQEPIVVGQSAYNTAYNTTFPATYPNWGVSRILDDSISFKTVDGTVVKNVPMKRKAIHDEMGAAFDDYGRMSAKLGLEIPFANAATQTFVLQNYIDPTTETVYNNGVQLWRITHNGVDTHPVHFHLFDVQVINRVGWDGFIRLPDPNELGWKDTVRVSPLEDTIVALRPKTPKVPFALPNNVRPLNPAQFIGSEMGFSQTDITDGGNLNPPMTNKFVNFGYEYVWHCHILSHEENDMMRSTVLARVPQNDFVGLGRTDLTVWRPGTGEWFSRTLSSGTTVTTPFGTDGDKLVPGDYDGDTKSDVAVWRPTDGTWYVVNSSTKTQSAVPWGTNGDTPVPGDYDGDGKTDFAVWRPSVGTWYTLYSTTNTRGTLQWGTTGDLPVPGDYDGDGKTDVAVWRAGTWYIVDSSTNANREIQWGTIGDLPVPGDYDGDHKTDVAVWRDSTASWHVINSRANTIVNFQWGQSGDIPVPGDYDNIGMTEFAVWRPADSVWHILNPITNSATSVPWGAPTDQPVKTGQPIP
ncbi:MAG: copper oxidase [Deltaproteobacteria bacterium]|nr:copper oxidase [Deltaproteobacteria bacterium]